MTRRLPLSVKSQSGYTLVEVVISAAIGALLLGALISVILTSTRAVGVATSRVEASSQIRSFETFAYEDFAGSGVPTINCPGTPPCTVALTGTQVPNSTQPVPAQYTVTYTWDGTNVDRQAGSGSAIHAATDVTSFTSYIDSTAAFPTVVVGLTVTVGAYSESQTFRFYPRMNP